MAASDVSCAVIQVETAINDLTKKLDLLPEKYREEISQEIQVLNERINYLMTVDLGQGEGEGAAINQPAAIDQPAAINQPEHKISSSSGCSGSPKITGLSQVARRCQPYTRYRREKHSFPAVGEPYRSPSHQRHSIG